MKSRTPKHYSGTQNPAKKVSDLLSDYMLQFREKHALNDIEHFWNELLGEKMASLTRIVSFENGILTVKVKSSTLYSLLAVHERGRLLSKLQEKFQVRNLIFRVG